VKTPIFLNNSYGEWAVSVCISGAGVFACMGALTLRGRPLSLYSFNKGSALTAMWLVLLVIAIGSLCRATTLAKPMRYRRTLGICAALLMSVHASVSLFCFPDRYDWGYYATRWEALLYGLAALIGFLLLWLTSYEVMFRRMGRTSWKKLHNAIYILLALGLLHVCHQGKPLCWLDWLEGTQTQSCVRDGRIPPLSFILLLGLILVSIIRLLEPLARRPIWVDDRNDEDD
jgi:DMSO/TMAO reductase YedYZ heme-binding membrane subunit